MVLDTFKSLLSSFDMSNTIFTVFIKEKSFVLWLRNLSDVPLLFINNNKIITSFLM